MKTTKRRSLLLLSLLLAPWFVVTLVAFASADDCARYVQKPTNLLTIPRGLIEDCMRTGYAQAIATAITASIAGGLISHAVGQALRQAAQQAQKEEQEEKEREQEKKKTNYFRVRVHRGGDVGGAIGAGFITVIIEEWDGQSWGGSKYLTYKGIAFPYVGTRASVTSASSDWKEFSTPEPMTADEFAGAGSVTYWPGISFGPWGTNAGVTLNFATLTGKKVQVHVDSSGAGLGFTFCSHFWLGYWTTK
jgi:uncharacterized membrane protein